MTALSLKSALTVLALAVVLGLGQGARAQTADGPAPGPEAGSGNGRAPDTTLEDTAEQALDLLGQGFALGREWLGGFTDKYLIEEPKKLFDQAVEAAAAGNAAAQNLLGEMYLSGTYVQQDKQEAIRWFDKACTAGHQQACANFRAATEQSF